MEDPEVTTVEWDEGSSQHFDDATTGSNVEACWDAPVGRVESPSLGVEAPRSGAHVEDDGWGLGI